MAVSDNSANPPAAATPNSPVLRWDRPPRAMSTAEWKAISADGAPPGVYTPNMSDTDKLTWKAKLAGGKDPRAEIRKTVTAGYHYAQVLIVIRPDQTVTVSGNGTMCFSQKEWAELAAAVEEARHALQNGKPCQNQ